jgi:hypothetical protein
MAELDECGCETCQRRYTPSQEELDLNFPLKYWHRRALEAEAQLKAMSNEFDEWWATHASTTFGPGWRSQTLDSFKEMHRAGWQARQGEIDELRALEAEAQLHRLQHP